MKRSSASFLLLASLHLMISCGATAESAGASVGASKVGAAPEAVSPAATPETGAAAKDDCILGYQRKLDEMLPLDIIKKHYTGEMAGAQMKYDKSPPERDADQDKYVHRWKSDRTRTMEMNGTKMEIPLPNEIGVMWVGSDLFMIKKAGTPLENFKAFYRNATQEEMDAAFKIAEARLKSDPKFAKDQVEAATGMARGMTATDKFVDVPGLGDAAVFNKQEDYLTVLKGATTFQVIASVSADKDVNLDLAKKLATDILARCR